LELAGWGPGVHGFDHALDFLIGQIGMDGKTDFGGDAAGGGAVTGEIEDDERTWS